METTLAERQYACTFTGHRNLTYPEMIAVEPVLRGMITQLASQNVKTFIAGGALGFDTLAAATVINLRRMLLPDIRLILALPCPEQADRWSTANRALYRDISANADEVRMISPAYTSDCMRKRNRYMVDHSAYLMAYVSRRSGGSFSTMQYAQKQGLCIQNLSPNAVQIENNLL